MIRNSLRLAVWVVLVPSALARADAVPAAPQISLGQGAILVNLARSAMRQYLTARTPAEQIVIPDELKQARWAGEKHSVFLTLRSNGQAVAHASRPNAEVCQGVIASALEAMRSPHLPDHVTEAVLDGLVIEIEVAGEHQPVQQEDLATAIIPGLTGVRITRGLDESIVLPSTACEEGLQGRLIVQRCIRQLPVSSPSIELPLRWSVFLTAHFVGYPDGKAVRLHRGKVLLPTDSIDAKSLPDYARIVGAYLVRHQESNGCYSPMGAAPSVVEHVYATYAMARLAWRVGDKGFAASANKAMAHAMDFVKQENRKALVMTESPEDQLTATALLALAAGEMPPAVGGENIREMLIAGLRQELGDEQSLTAKLAASGEPGRTAAPPSAAWLRGACLACKAIGDAEDLSAIRTILGRHLPPDAETAMWMTRCGIPPLYLKEAPTVPALEQVPANGPVDEAGGFFAVSLPNSAAQGGPDANAAEGGMGVSPAKPPEGEVDRASPLSPAATIASQTAAAKGDANNGAPAKIEVTNAIPSTVATALRMCVLADDVSSPSATEADKASFLAAARFCCQQMYRPREATLAPDGDDWTGGVRENPASARITLDACAAVIEALLSLKKPF